MRLWDAVVAWTEFPQLYELQRPKTGDEARLIAETFRPYLGARDWVSINRGEVINIDAPGASAAADAGTPMEAPIELAGGLNSLLKRTE